MASQYGQSSAAGLKSSFGEDNPAGNGFEPGTAQTLGMDTFMAGGDTSDTANTMSHRSAPAGMPGRTQAFGSAFEPSPLASPADQHQTVPRVHRSSTSTFPDGQSPVLAPRHRLSIGSNEYASRDRHNSFGGSDDTTSDGQRGNGNLGENSIGNDTAGSQLYGDDNGGANYEAHGAVPPPWSELKTKAGKERKRLPLACIACRRKKIRCSGEKPACKHCLRSRIPCVYKVTTRKAAPRTDYMAMLDKRLKRMEERVIKIIPREEQGIVTITGRAVVKPPLPSAPTQKPAASKKRAVDAAFGEDLDEWANGKAIGSKSREDMQQDNGRKPPGAHDPEEHNLLQEGADMLPSKEVQEHLSEVFFDYVYGQSYHLLHKPSFIRKLAQGTVPPVLMLAVCAISARFSNHPSVRSEPTFLRGENWASAARDIALRRYDTPNLTILIVYLILGLHEFGTCQGGRSWMFGGMAQRMAYALQLHRDLDHEPMGRSEDEKSELTFTDREIRRRTMWSCFLMDRFNSSGTDRPIFVGEQYIRAQLPIKETYYQMEVTGPTEDLNGNIPNPIEPDTGHMANPKENMGVAAYLIRLVAIWGSLIHYLNLGGKEKDEYPMWAEESTFQKIKCYTEQWKGLLPESLHYTTENLQNHASEKIANQFILMHIIYYQIILFMNRFALPIPGSRSAFPKDMPAEFISEAAHAAHEAANKISALIHEGMDHLLVAPFAGYCAFFSSTVHIYGAFSKNPAIKASSKQNLAWNVKYLTRMKNYWGMFHFITENLRDLYRRHADASRSGKQTGGKENDQAIFQYGDWFARYPHGVSGTDFEEPSVDVKKEPGADAVLGQKSDLQTVEEFFSKLSPPSRIHQSHQQQSQRRKKRQSRSDARPAQLTDPQQQQQSSTEANQEMERQQRLPQAMFEDMLPSQAFPGNFQSFQQQNSTAFPPGFQQPPNPLLAAPTQQFVSQLDRHMVLNSYAGINPPSGAIGPSFQQNTSLNNATLDFTNQHGPETFDFTVLANFDGNNMWGDPSTAWFMPFNMDPPAVGEDSNLFTGNLDWSEFKGNGELASDMSLNDMASVGNLNVNTDQKNPGDNAAGSMGGMNNML